MPVQPGEPGVDGRVHVFAIASNGTQPDLGFEATVGDDVTGTAGEALEVTSRPSPRRMPPLTRRSCACSGATAP